MYAGCCYTGSLWKSRRDRGVYAERGSRGEDRERERVKSVRGDRDREIDRDRDRDATG